MSNKTYDILKNIALIVLPAFATFVLTVAQIWNLPYGKEIAATITAIDVFLGAVIKIASMNYAKNNEVITIPTNTDDKKAN